MSVPDMAVVVCFVSNRIGVANREIRSIFLMGAAEGSACAGRPLKPPGAMKCPMAETALEHGLVKI